MRDYLNWKIGKPQIKSEFVFQLKIKTQFCQTKNGRSDRRYKNYCYEQRKWEFDTGNDSY